METVVELTAKQLAKRAYNQKYQQGRKARLAECNIVRLPPGRPKKSNPQADPKSENPQADPKSENPQADPKSENPQAD